MRLSEYVEYDATGLASLVTAGEMTAVELTHLARQAHDGVNPSINAVIEFYEDAESISSKNAGLFNGVPFFRKDVGASEAGRLQEKGSRLFKGYRSNIESYFFHRAREGGLRTLGRTATPEFATSGITESILNGITGNPWDLERSAGGSSGGAAAAVAAGITPIAHGNDGGGSIRVPAAWCGLVGLNPSRGRISGGPNQQDASLGCTREFVLCQTVRDAAAALDVFSGPHPGDPFIIVQPNRPYVEELSRPTGTLRVGVAKTKWGAINLDPEVQHAVESMATLLEEMGHVVIDIKPPYESIEYTRIMLAGLSFNASSREDAARAMRRTISAETLEPINLKLYEYSRNLQTRVGDVHEALRSMRLHVGEAIQDFDILLTPTMPMVALPHGSVYSTTNPTLSVEEWVEADAALYQYTGVFNVTGQPAVSLPLAQNASGLPIGIQIVGRFGDEATLVRVARDLEEARPWGHRRAKVRAGHTVCGSDLNARNSKSIASTPTRAGSPDARSFRVA
ncbi:amidase [Mesorhizobium sp.]|uniref:amidase n=1 Tax=Mesorhizobium sp. TaxID=1871066 RepID=UPI000FD25FBE|nr:amidase [Mesorhizobium sp.]RVC61965.1 amidase [Mesorhizobium sp. M4B.F.Ca.ET.088.02.2.1]RVD74296.1 amidase [Mesorhizobium sp. M4A.F.Ca.ET.029.04.2.1]RWF28755.1 MAG: amidase [Mesorhizobium sp.]RWL02818.1 MAG: amidase [Mesorhizobium sp.]